VYGSERTSERSMLRRSCKAPRRLKTPIISQPAGEIGIFTILSAMTYSKGKMPQTEEEHWLTVTQEPSELAAISRQCREAIERRAQAVIDALPEIRGYISRDLVLMLAQDKETSIARLQEMQDDVSRSLILPARQIAGQSRARRP